MKKRIKQGEKVREIKKTKTQSKFKLEKED
jgi:hypothetical protein